MSKIETKTVEIHHQPMSFVDRLFEADKSWQDMSKAALEKNAAMLRSWSSEYYEPMAKTQKTSNHTMNLIDRATEIIIPYLVMNNPYIEVSTLNPKYRPYAYTTELAINQWIKHFKFAKTTLYAAVRNSLFSMGIVRSGIMKSYQVEIMGCLHDVGKPYADVVDVEDFVCDPAAKTFESAAIMGNYYYMPTDVAKEFFGNKFADAITSSVKLYSKGDAASRERYTITNFEDSPKFLKPMTRFVDHWLPDEGVIITNLADGGTKKILREVEWSGPASGPYDILAYKFMPDTPIPIPPAWSWLDIDAIFNVIINKVKQQALSQKTVLAYESEAVDDAARIADAGDRMTVKVDHLESLKPITFEGANPGLFQMLNYLQNQWSEQGKNLNTLGGLTTGADTLGQEQMLMANASKSLENMVNQVYSFTQSIISKCVDYIWDDPSENLTVIKEVKNVGQIAVDFNKAVHVGDLGDYVYSVKPLSMQQASPEAMFQKLIQLMTQWVLPTAQIAAQQGTQIDVPETTKRLAKYLGVDDFNGIYQTADSQTAKLNPYQPNAENKAITPGEAGMNGAASRNQNLLQKEARPTLTPNNTGK